MRNRDNSNPPAPPISILLADDNSDIRASVSGILQMAGYTVSLFDPCQPDEAILEKMYDIIILDILMPGFDGFNLRELILPFSPNAQFILITGRPDREKLEKAMQLGFFSFLTKPFTAEQITYAVMGAVRMNRLLHDNREQALALAAVQTGLIGNSVLMNRIRQNILQYAPLNVPVLIHGESGTGKELAAAALHHYSSRKNSPLTAVNCAGLSANLIESELFGHSQGSFTGAHRTKFGFFEVADKGTLFLDEIGDFPLELQSKLLRVLDSGEYIRVGETKCRITDTRIISATNRNLEEMVSAGTFRADLYYRLKGASITMPPLRQHPEDIPALVVSFLKNGSMAMAPDALELLNTHTWPGNVRELRLVLRTLEGMATNHIITYGAVATILNIAHTHQPHTASAIPTYRDYKASTLAASERVYFESILTLAGHNMTEAARIAGIDRKNLYVKLSQLGISQ